ncbi:PKD domain-containing protein [Rhodohalobacter sulfatireducens]|uniref:PKD domain-containing protein n=1 Tax=Rhodohalobacter sulfatireducens TaxID=2911366 RepID=A0ABS9KE10_9BACT|nr:PKD domain-containing protein [Rhodohalobacter sulfatireducens]MCG2589075.1 PKD domain-containing protein [Rhodohalobacter sulfatireducens]
MKICIKHSAILRIIKIGLFIITFTGIISNSQESYGQEMSPPSFTLDFEEGNLRGWQTSGRAFVNQPVSSNQMMSLNGEVQFTMQGNHWVTSGTNRLTGTLTSNTFTIPEGTLSFLIRGSGAFETRVVLYILDQIEGRIRAEYATGYELEVERAEWDLSRIAGRTGLLQVIDESGSDNISVDNFVFSQFSNFGSYPNPDVAVFDPNVIYDPGDQVQPTAELSLSTSFTEIGSVVEFEAFVDPEYENTRYNFHFGNGEQSGWQPSPETTHTYRQSDRYEAFVEVITGPSGLNIRSEPVAIEVLIPEVSLVLNADKTNVFVNESIEFSGGSDNDSVSMIISFGDDNFRNFDGSVVEYSYPFPGTFDVDLVAYIQEEFAGSQTVRINVANPSLNLISGDNFVQTGNTILFSLQLEPARPEFTYEINYGDENTESFGIDEQINHRYNTPGIYRVSAIARHPNEELIVNSNPLQITAVDVRVTSDRDILQVGERSRLTGIIEPGIVDAEFSFIVGDSTFSSATPDVDYTFNSSGDHEVTFMATIDGRTFTSNPFTVTVQSDYTIRLITGKTEASKDERIQFTAMGIPSNLLAEYKFYFGDGEESEWSESSTTFHSYRSNGSYNAFVEARIPGGEYIQSSIINLEVGERGFTTWVITVTGILVVLLGGYIFIRGRLKKKSGRNTKPKGKIDTIVTPRKDLGNQQISPGSLININREITIKPVKDIGMQKIKNVEHLLKKEWRQNDESSH